MLKNVYKFIVILSTLIKTKILLLKPSAGSGSFFNAINQICDNILLLDIEPKHSRVQPGNFLKFDKNLSEFKKVHIVGNPPFTILNKFIKQASKLADNIGFILPLSFRKESRKKAFPLNFHCVYEYVLLNNTFHFNNTMHKVPTVFQI